MKWSDGQPLTSEDVAYTINRARKEEWLNYTSIVANLTAKAPRPDDAGRPHRRCRTRSCRCSTCTSCRSTSTTSTTPRRSRSTTAQDGVGSGPFVLDKFVKGQFARFKPNPYYYAGKPAARPTSSSATSTTPTRWSPRSSAARSTPSRTCRAPRSRGCEQTKGIATVQGYQGAFNEFALNYGDGLKKAQPGAVGPARAPGDHARDRQEDDRRPRRERVRVAGRGDQPVGEPGVDARRSRRTQVYDFDLAKANKILDDAGYKDTNGDGIREMPGGGKPLKLRYAVRSEADSVRTDGRVHHRLAAQDRHRHHREDLQRQAAHRADRQGRLRPVRVGLDAVRRPRPGCSATSPAARSATTPRTRRTTTTTRTGATTQYDKLYDAAEGRARTRRSACRSCTRCSRASTGPPTYDALYTYPDLQAYRTGRFTGWTRQPDEHRAGAVLQHLADLRQARAGRSRAAAGGGRRVAAPG